MTNLKSSYDVVIIGSGHNGLVSACYLAGAGLSVLVLERNDVIGGATRSSRPFAGIDANLSVYSYLVSLFPQKIISDLGLNLCLKSRSISSWTPSIISGKYRELLIRSDQPESNRVAFAELTGSDTDYVGYRQLQSMQEDLASAIWPGLTEPLVSRATMRNKLNPQQQRAWQVLVEQPVGTIIEELISDDLIRGLVFTDARIGISTWPEDPSLIQNRCFLYHIIGQGTGEWMVPVGGMGALVSDLVKVAQSSGRVTIATGAEVTGIDPGSKKSIIEFIHDDKELSVDARFVLCNASRQVLNQLTANTKDNEIEPAFEGAGFKMNLLLKKLPKLRSDRYTPAEAFAGTVHIDEGYEQMIAAYHESVSGRVPEVPPGEIYCHTLTDPSILSEDLNRQGYHTLTLFGLDMPWSLFETDNETVRNQAAEKYLAGINRYLAQPIQECLAEDSNGEPCIDAMSAYDLEQKLHLPKGNIFHGDLTWPFCETEDETGQWGVETEWNNIYICGSSAIRGGAVSGIPGHNAAMKVMEQI